MTGFVLLHRSFIEWEWYDDTNVMRLFLHLILKANHKNRMWRGIEIKRGQILTSVGKLSEETGLTVSQIRTSIDKLKLTKEITSKTTSKYTLLTIEKYSIYQDKGCSVTSKTTSHQQTSNKRVTTNNNVNNDNNDNNLKTNVAFSKSKMPGCPMKDIVNLYHVTLPELPALIKFTTTREKHLRSRWRENPEMQNIKAWGDFFEHIKKSDFLMGRSKDFKASFDWIIKPENFAKIYEGRYHQ
jgi:hypothetical protein